MEKLLIIDDGRPIPFREYQPLLREREVHLAFYLDSLGGERAREYAEETILNSIKETYNLKTAQAYTHEQLVSHLQEHHPSFQEIAVDGLEGQCFTSIQEVPLPLDKTTVVTSSPEILRFCKEGGTPCKDKMDLS